MSLPPASSASTTAPGPLGVFGAGWGLAGVVALLVNAVLRLAPIAAEAIGQGLSTWQWIALIGCVAFMAFFEGYRGFQRGFAPRVVVRARHLARRPRLLHVLLAPLYCMGLVHAARRRLVASWILTISIVCLVIGVRLLPQPWRGILDAGVVVGLAWGVVALLVYAVRALAGRPPAVSAELPAGESL